MLSQQYPEAKLAQLLVGRDEWRPFPTANERAAWDGLPDAVRARHIADGVGYLDHDWPTVLATRFLDYVRDGDRDRMPRASFGRRSALVALVLAECTEGEGRFIDDIVNRTETAMPQAHCFLASELALRAQAVATRLTHDPAG